MYAIYWLLQWNHAVEKHGWKTPFKSAPAIKCPCHNSFGFSHDHVAPSSTTLNRPNSRETDMLSNTVPGFSEDQHTCFWWWNLPTSIKSSHWTINRNNTHTALAGGARDLKGVRFGYILFYFIFGGIRLNMKETNSVMMMSIAAEGGLARNKQKSCVQRTKDEFMNNTKYG